MMTFSISACSDDGTNTPTQEEPDTAMGPGPDVGGGANPDLDASPGTDVEEADTTQPDTGGALDSGGTPDVGPDPDTTTGEPDVAPDVEDYECFYPSADPNCAQGPFGPGSFITSLNIVSNRTCCFDYTGDGRNDNAIGVLLGQIQALPGMSDVNANIAFAINQGLLSYVFEFSNFANPFYDPSLNLRVLLGEDTDEFFADNLGGEGAFNVLPESFEEDGTTPKWAFDEARVNNGKLIASGGAIDLTFPGLIDEVAISLVDVHVRADVVDEAGKEPDLTAGGRVWLSNGELAGVLLRDKLFESMNNAALGCDCIQDARPLMYSYNQDQDKYVCELTADDATRCNSASSACSDLANRTICLFFASYSTNVDVDSSGDGTNDGYSVGVRFESVGASIEGMAADAQ